MFKIIVGKNSDRSIATILQSACKNDCMILSSDVFKIDSIESDDDHNTIINIHSDTCIFALEFWEESFQVNFKRIGNDYIMDLLDNKCSL